MAPDALRPLLALLHELYREGGVTVTTPLDGACERVGAVTVIQPDGGVLVRVAPELVEAPDLAARWAEHEDAVRARLAPLLMFEALVQSLRVWCRWGLRAATLGLVAGAGTLGLLLDLTLVLIVLPGGVTLTGLLARHYRGRVLDWAVGAVLQGLGRS